MSYSVGEVAGFAGITVRTLHHYDEIGLLSPGGRSAAGYRQYADDDLERLQRILCYRELGFALDEVATILDDPTTDAMAHLHRQHRLLLDRIAQLQRMVTAVETTMEARKMGISLTPDEMFEVFDDHDPTRYAEEAERRWGDTEAYRESQQRTTSYTKHDWLRIKAEGDEVVRGFSAALVSGVPAASDEAMDLAEAHRDQISRWFYDCSYEMHRGLAEMYVADPRFTAHYDDHAPGLARYVHDAILANAERGAAS